MEILLRTTFSPTHQSTFTGSYDATAELNQHGLHAQFNSEDAEKALSGKSAYTYVIHPCYARGFTFSFVNQEGVVEHHPLTLLNPMFGIWRNMLMSNIGTLAQVLCTMMHGNKGQPL